MVASIASLFYNPAVTKALGFLGGETTVSLALRDSADNFRRVQIAQEEDPLFGKEMFRLHWGTTVVWGFGMKLMNSLFDGVSHKLGKPFTALETGTLNPKNAAYVAQWIESAAKVPALQNKAKSLGQLFKPNMSAEGMGQLAKLYKGLGGWRFLVASMLPTIAIGVGIPWYNHRASAKELQTKFVKEAPWDLRNNNGFLAGATSNSISSATSAASTVPVVSPFQQALAPGSLQGQPNLAQTLQPKFGAAGSWLAGASKLLHENEKLANLIGIDTFISGPRMALIRKPGEFVNFLLQEGILVYMLYFGPEHISAGLQKAFSAVPGFTDAGGIKGFKGAEDLYNLPFKLFSSINQRFLQTSKGLSEFNSQLSQSLRDLGLDASLKGEALAKHLAEPGVIERLEGNLNELLLPGKFNAQGETGNLIADLAVEADLVPVWRDGWLNSGKILGRNPTKAMKLAEQLHPEKSNPMGRFFSTLVPGKASVLGHFDNVQSMIYRLSQAAELATQPEGEKAFKAIFGRTIVSKSLAMIAALGASYLVIAEASPRIQRWAAKALFNEDPSDWTGSKAHKAAALAAQPANTPLQPLFSPQTVAPISFPALNSPLTTPSDFTPVTNSVFKPVHPVQSMQIPLSINPLQATASPFALPALPPKPQPAV